MNLIYPAETEWLKCYTCVHHFLAHWPMDETDFESRPCCPICLSKNNVAPVADDTELRIAETN